MMLSAIFLVLGLAAQAASASQAPAPPAPASLSDELWDAARAGDAARAAAALDRGADVNAKSRYGVTALMFAADKGHTELVRLLLDRGADPNLQDTFYRFRAVDMAVMNRHTGTAVLLLERGAAGAPPALSAGVQRGDVALVRAALASSEITAEHLRSAAAAAKRTGHAEIVGLIDAKAAALPADAAPPPVTVPPATLRTYAGAYRNESSGLTMTFAADATGLTLLQPGGPPRPLVAVSPTLFRLAEVEGVSFEFRGRGGAIESVLLVQRGQTQTLARVPPSPASAAEPGPAAAPAAAAGAPADPAPRTSPRPWPSFRGENASGNGDGQGAVAEWNVENGTNVLWKTPVPGISNASPIVWGDRVFVTTAISTAGDRTFRTGLYGDVTAVDDLSEHAWKVYCLDLRSGKVLWEQTASTGRPGVKRHMKASQANSTPVTDGRRVVALFGSIGLLAAWDMTGTPLWKTEVGVLDSGWFFDPTYQWGHSSSPVIHQGKVIVQADVQKGSYIAAYDVETGRQVWRTDRDEISTWGTPTLFQADGRTQIVTNGPTIRSYELETGKLLWSLGPNSEIAVATPVVGGGLVYVTGGYAPVRPIYAVKPTASGAIRITNEQPASDAVAWSNTSGTYIPTPLYYDGILYTCGNEGIVTAYDAKTGQRLYRARAGGGGSFSASPVAADGRLYFSNEDGDVIVARAGRAYQELAKNRMNEVIMSTPAISDGVIVIRTLSHVYGIGRPAR